MMPSTFTRPPTRPTAAPTLARAFGEMSGGEAPDDAMHSPTLSLDGHAPVVPAAYLEPLPSSRRLRRSEAGLLLDTAARACAEARGLGTRLAVISAHRLRSRTTFQRLGYRSDADYAREELRMTPRAFRDLARLGARLEALPEVRQAFLRGDLTRSQAEVVAGVATPEDENEWLARAAQGTVRQLKAAARRARAEELREDDPTKEDDPAKEDVTAPENGTGREDGPAAEAGPAGKDSPRRARIPVSPDDDTEPRRRRSFEVPRTLLGKIDGGLTFAARVAGADLPAGALWELIAAEYLSGMPPVTSGDAAEAAGRSGPAPSPVSESALATTEPAGGSTLSSSRQSEQTPEDPRGYQAILERDSGRWRWLPHDRPPLETRGEWRDLQRRLADPKPRSAWQLHDDLTTALAAERRVAWQLGRLLTTIRNRRLWRDMLFASFAHYVRERLGFSVRTAQRLIRVDREAWRYLPLRRAWEGGELSVLLAEALLRVLRHVPRDARAQQDWIDFAGNHTTAHVLEAIRATELRRTAEPPAQRPQTPPTFVTCQYAVWMSDGEFAVLQRAIEAVRARDPGGGHAEGDDSACLEALLEEFLSSYAATAREMRRNYPLFERDGWQCRVPGCSAHGPLHLHHIVFRAHGGSDQPENLVTLCDFHHKALHARWIRCTGRAPHALYWELGVDCAVGFGRPPLARFAGNRRLADTEYWDGVRVREVPGGARRSTPPRRCAAPEVAIARASRGRSIA